MSRRSPWERRDDIRDDRRPLRAARPWPTTLLWRGRYEVLLLVGAASGVALLVRVVGGRTATAMVVAIVAGGVSVPAVRRVSTLVWWHVVTPHLFRRCCAELGFWDRKGRLPAVLRTRTSRAGQELLLFCQASVSLKDLVRASDELTTGMWAQDVVVRRHRRHGQIVVVTVVRDDRLAAGPPLDDGPAPWSGGDEVTTFTRVPRQAARGPVTAGGT